MEIIGISGKRRSGKSFLADMIFKGSNKHFRVLALAYPLKRDLQKKHGWTYEHTDGELKEKEDPKTGLIPRFEMIKYGQEMRAKQPDYWIQRFFEAAEKVAKEGHGVVVPDVRFPNEANAIRKQGGILVRLERTLEDRGLANDINDPSETGLDDYKIWNVWVAAAANRNLEDLQRTADAILGQRVGSFSKVYSWSGL